jgi:hypothetical protein
MTFPGRNFVMLGSNQTGDLGLKFRDIDYSDNKGEFTVTILYIPASQVPKAKDIETVSEQKELPPAQTPMEPACTPSIPSPSQTGESPWLCPFRGYSMVTRMPAWAAQHCRGDERCPARRFGL